ncbi:hypothetical protein EDD11_007769 [Mortierella claussenii]|nr:hypothetical protein EDD11_007769 [Mortierella claussenii]
MAPEIVTMTPGGGLSHLDHDYKKRYEAAAKDAKQWEKKYSALQHQIHYERERWEEKYGTLEKTLRDVENSKVEANIEKMNSLLNMIQQLQVANEVFRKQLKDAGIEPDPMPAAQFHSHCLLVGENLDRTFLEENELMKERSLAMNQKITHLSTEMNNAAIAISQTINYVQLRYLTQMLDAAEHVTSQKRARAMSNTFLSDMLSRGVKKAGPLQPKNTCTIATQTPSAILTAMQMQQQHEFQQQFMRQQLNNGMAPWGAERIRRLESKRSRSFMSLAGIIGSHGANGENDEGGSNGTKEIQYKLKGGAMEDSRSQLTRQAISSLVIEDLKGSPVTPDTADLLMATKSATPTPKFQYASPTSSQLRIFVPDVNYPDGYSRTPSAGSRSRASSLHRRSVSDISVAGIEAAEGSLKKSGSNTSLFPPKSHEPQSQRGMVTSSSSGLPRSTSQQFLSPEMAILYSNSQ